MISFDLDSCRFNLRVAGLALHNDHLLLHRGPGEAFWTAPGGRCEPMEPTSDTVRREFAEELGVEVEVGPLSAIVENFFEYEGRRCHEHCFYYPVILPNESLLLQLTKPILPIEVEAALEFRWCAVDALHTLEVRPTCLLDIVRERDGAGGVRHIVHRG